jgi:hypothetical protein
MKESVLDELVLKYRVLTTTPVYTATPLQSISYMQRHGVSKFG